MKNNLVSKSFKVRISPHRILMFWLSGIRFDGHPNVLEYGGGVLCTRAAGGDIPVSYRGFQISCFGWRWHWSRACYTADVSDSAIRHHSTLPVAV
jgi:hypothetical protein